MLASPTPRQRGIFEPTEAYAVNEHQERHESRRKLTISIDGVNYTTRDDDQEAPTLLRLAGVDPAQHDLRGSSTTTRPRSTATRR